MDRNAPLCEWQRNPARPDPKLEGAATSGKLDQQVNDRGDDLAEMFTASTAVLAYHLGTLDGTRRRRKVS